MYLAQLFFLSLQPHRMNSKSFVLDLNSEKSLLVYFPIVLHFDLYYRIIIVSNNTITFTIQVVLNLPATITTARTRRTFMAEQSG